MEAYPFPQFSGSRSQVHAALYTNVTNAAAVRKRIIDAATASGPEGEAARDAVNFAYIDARLITSRLHLQTAIYQAMLAESQDSLRTRTVHSEIIWALNPTNNITEALRRYGISDKTTVVIVVSMDGASEDKLGAGIIGTLSPMDELERLTDWTAVRKGAGRAVTQANATISSNDGSFSQSDDQEDVPTRRSTVQSSRRSRIRSSSLSIPAHSRNERGENIGVLKSVQLHARSRHAFAPQVTPATASIEDPVPSSPRPALVRRNSTSAPPPTEEFDPTIPAPSPQSSRRSSISSPALPPTDPAAPQTVEPPQPAKITQQPPPSPKAEVSHATKKLINARDSGDSSRAAAAVREFRQTVVNPSVREFNAALEALQATRRSGEPLNLMLDTYNDMLRHSLLPNVHTYINLIDALTARDNEVHIAITALEGRIKHRMLTGFTEITSEAADRKRIEALRREVNFPTAMTLFEAILSIGGNDRLTAHTYTSLIRSCANHGNIDAAIHIFAQQEQREQLLPSPRNFTELIRVYANGGQLEGAEQVFEEYRAALKRGEVHIVWNRENFDTRRNSLLAWNQMIETYFRFDRADKAVGLVQEMLDAEPDKMGLVADPPQVSTATFTTVLTGFCQTGDVATAVVWFDRLLAQKNTSKDPYEPLGQALRPDDVAWTVMLDALAVKGMVNDINRLFVIRLQEKGADIHNTHRYVVYAANMAHLAEMSDEHFLWSLDFLQNHVLNTPKIKIKHRTSPTADIASAYLDRKMYDKALAVISAYFSSWLVASTTSGHDLGIPPPIMEVQGVLLKFAEKLYEVSQGFLPYTVSMELARVAGTVRITLPSSYTPFFMHSYGLARASNTLPTDMTLRDWELLVMAASELEQFADSPNAPQATVPDYAFQGLVSLLRDLATYGVTFGDMNSTLIRTVILQLTQRLGMENFIELCNETGFTSIVDKPGRVADALQQAVDDPTDVSSSSDSGYASQSTGAEPPLRVDGYLSKTIQDELRRTGLRDEDRLTSAIAKFRMGVEKERAPSPNTISLLIQNLGRAGRTEEMHYAYSVAQRVLAGLESKKEWQTEAWFDVENAMVIGLAHHGDVESAHVHRMRILQQGGALNADAYGALIYNVKDTTDDASNALELFNEAQAHNVPPNGYLYNNIISKLARARKADYAMELFQQMKALDISPTSVTFGAVIGACARVGDVHSAELLFTEMTQAPNFKPRVPPYNTMMQMYTTTKPDRARVLHFYREMRKVNIPATAHTYKLLLDAYGSIEPVDIAEMSGIFRTLETDRNVSVQGTHYASVINAHGCVSKNLPAAIKVFDNMSIAPDNLVYETMINVLVVHRRADLFPEYINKMHLAGIHMTAYIANSLIKGYALVDRLQEAQEVFESLEDPPVGVAAPNNHAPHSPAEVSPLVDQSSPVYREPSTWEAMIRAELGAGNRNGALALLERLKARQVLFVTTLGPTNNCFQTIPRRSLQPD
ncbi:hypothetical protein DXG01_013775 [Tephrocybe rancida]|nr:hypothetical protein DXG01_013775 [Tephrocybe rancida]